MKFVKKSCLLVFLLSAGLFVSLSPGLTEAKVIQVALGATSSASGYYAWCVGLGQVATKFAPNINVSLVGGARGGINMAKQIKNGVVHIAAMGTLSIPYNMYHGTGPFKGKKWDSIRLFGMREVMVYRMYVRADSGLKTWSDLKGKKFNPGTPGSSNSRNTAFANKALGTGLKIVPGTISDAIKGIKEGRIVGMNKSSPPDRFDGGMLEVHYNRPLTVLGFTKEDADKMRAQNPLMFFKETKAGSIKELPDLGTILEMSSIGLMLTSSNMPEDVGYRIIKALHQNWGEVAKSYPPVGKFDPIRDLIKHIPKGTETFLHAGVVKYAKEIGIQVPAVYIPPEYKGTR